MSGKGQFTCGARGCHEGRGLATFEVPFGYTEAGERKEALVKVGPSDAHHISKHIYMRTRWKKTKGAARNFAVPFWYVKAGTRKEGLVKMSPPTGHHMITAHRPTAEMPRQLSRHGKRLHSSATNREGAISQSLGL